MNVGIVQGPSQSHSTSDLCGVLGTLKRCTEFLLMRMSSSPCSGFHLLWPGSVAGRSGRVLHCYEQLLEMDRKRKAAPACHYHLHPLLPRWPSQIQEASTPWGLDMLVIHILMPRVVPSTKQNTVNTSLDDACGGLSCMSRNT